MLRDSGRAGGNPSLLSIATHIGASQPWPKRMSWRWRRLREKFSWTMKTVSSLTFQITQISMHGFASSLAVCFMECGSTFTWNIVQSLVRHYLPVNLWQDLLALRQASKVLLIAWRQLFCRVGRIARMMCGPFGGSMWFDCSKNAASWVSCCKLQLKSKPAVTELTRWRSSKKSAKNLVFLSCTWKHRTNRMEAYEACGSQRRYGLSLEPVQLWVRWRDQPKKIGTMCSAVSWVEIVHDPDKKTTMADLVRKQNWLLWVWLLLLGSPKGSSISAQ